MKWILLYIPNSTLVFILFLRLNEASNLFCFLGNVPVTVHTGHRLYTQAPGSLLVVPIRSQGFVLSLVCAGSSRTYKRCPLFHGATFDRPFLQHIWGGAPSDSDVGGERFCFSPELPAQAGLFSHGVHCPREGLRQRGLAGASLGGQGWRREGRRSRVVLGLGLGD